MAFALKPGRPVTAQLRRLLDGEIGGALGELGGMPGEAAIHAARRHIKKARAVLRLLDADLEQRPLARCESALRAAGRALSAWRDAAVLLRTIAALAGGRPAKAAANALQGLREICQAHGTAAVDTGALQTARLALQEARAALASHGCDECGFDALADGFAITYRSGRRALRRAAAKPTAARLHALRKALKHHLYQLRLLQPLWPGPLGAVHAQADHAAELIGLHHDCAVLRARLAGSALTLADKARIDALAAKRQDALAPAALDICRRLYAERGGSYRRRLEAYWNSALRTD